MDVFGHDDPCVEIESEAGLGDEELFGECVLHDVIVEEWLSVVARECEKPCVVGDLVAFERLSDRRHAPWYQRIGIWVPRLVVFASRVLGLGGVCCLEDTGCRRRSTRGTRLLLINLKTSLEN